MICRKSLVKNSRAAGSAVHLNVYDLTSINGYAYWLGLGVYHSGVQVHGVEYAFGAHEYPTTGIFEGEPKQCDGFTFRKSILIGFTDKTPRQVRGLMEELAEKYRGNKYNLITKNCNHFCNDACIKLTGNLIPNWINRLARLGFLCQCMIPVNLHSTRARHRKVEDKGIDVEKKKLTSQSNRFTNSCSNSSSSSSSSTPPVPSNGAESRRRSSLPLVLDSNTN